MKRLEATALTDVGIQRDHNEDAWAILQDVRLLAVADGMGGLEHGEIASKTAINTLRAARNVLGTVVSAVNDDPSRGPRAQLGHLLEVLTNLASQRIQQVTRGTSSGTTLVAACISGGHLIVANTGDSRAYLYRRGRLRCLTDDHTVAAARLRAGLISQDEHDASPYQHMLYQALGTQGEVNPDLFDERVAAEDRVLVCFYGLTGPVSEEEIAAILDTHSDPESAVEALVSAANNNGGPDNITVLLARVAEGPDPEAVDAAREVLLEARLLSGLSSVRRRLLLHYLDYVTLEQGEPLTPSRGFHLLLSGSISRADGGTYRAGEVVGVHEFTGAEAPEGPAIADEHTEAYVLTPEAYEALQERRPEVAARLLRELLAVVMGAPADPPPAEDEADVPTEPITLEQGAIDLDEPTLELDEETLELDEEPQG